MQVTTLRCLVSITVRKDYENITDHNGLMEARWLNRFDAALLLSHGVMAYSVRPLSWLESNCRVLAQVQDPRVPLRERMKFLAILSANIDEFFTVHGVKLSSRRGADGERSNDRSGWDELRTRLRQLVGEHHRYFLDELRPLLAADGIVVLRTEQASEAQRQ